MHVILGLLGTIVTILILLNRLAEAGIDLGGLNPFLWHRRSKWQKQFEGNPIYFIESPMDAAALLVAATAKADGDMSSEEKRSILASFREEFNLSKRDAASLLISSAYLLGKGEEVRINLKKVLKSSIEKFTEEQAKSTLDLMNKVCELETSGGELKREFIGQTRQIFEKHFTPKGKWQ